MTLRNMVFMINHAKSAGILIYTTFTIFHRIGYAAETITTHFNAELRRHSRTDRSTAARHHTHGR